MSGLYFKYYPINNYTLNLLATNSLWMSHPSTFNDPFDSFLSFKTSHDKDFIDFCYQKKHKTKKWNFWFLLKHLGPNSKGVDLSEFIRSLEQDESLDSSEIEDLLSEFFNSRNILAPMSMYSEYARLGICCFTKEQRSLLMWAHYASSHKGFCVAYKINELPPGVVLRDVNYDNDQVTPYQIDAMQKGELISVLQDQICQKSPNWKYENEMRLIGSFANQKVKVPGIIEEVIFGYRMSREDQETVKFLVSAHYPEATYSLAYPVPYFNIMGTRPEIPGQGL